jgi:hypothetical protein
MALEQFVAPPLPVPPPEYDQQYVTNLIRALRLYFNQLDSQAPNQAQSYRAQNFYGGLFSGEGYGIIQPYIGASDSTDQYASGNNTPTIVSWNTLTSGYGWVLNPPGVATASYAGVYKITYSLQFANSDNTIHDATVWLRVNGADASNSATIFSINARKSVGDPAYLAVYSEVVFEVQVGDTIALYWATDKTATSGGTTGIYIHHEPIQTSPYSRPAIPSAIGSISLLSAFPTPNVTGVSGSGVLGTVSVTTS